jgi:hypothetical protein
MMSRRPILPVLAAVGHQHRGDRVAVGLVEDQGVPKMLAGRWTECSEQVPELRFSVECLGHATKDS